MRSGGDVAAALRRVDVRLGIGLATAIGLLLVGLVVVLFLLATHETAELLQESLERELVATQSDAQRATPESPIAVRRIDADGRVEALHGHWPVAGRAFPAATSALRLAFASPRDHVVFERDQSDGSTLQAATGLSEFVAERREQLGQILLSLAVSLVGLAVVTLAATRLALAPIRAATHALDRVDEHHLDRRIPVRGTGDDVDRHAEVLNRVLARLDEAFRRTSAFSADVAHELRTPVNRMLNLTDLALLRERDGAAAADLEALRESAGGMRRLIDDLLLLARGDWGRLAARREPVALEPMLVGLAALFGPTFEERSIELRVREGADRVVALGDPDLLERAVSNLLDNALRHTPRDGSVEIGSGHCGSRVFLEISDSGAGVPEAERARVFDRFVRLDEARTGEGTGLGLALVRMIARIHGGDVAIGTGRLGGASFRITLPAA